ncbi:hypothetical protein RRG08_006741 [Elysia crispata]|uniref:Uncharacterized protein n=1 Tax=Elysia crispata TaxID=231223 RepID=A0AAE0XU19_9GAST|nr:hypothetical protein RRG08_006741 [Elysia crispata]
MIRVSIPAANAITTGADESSGQELSTLEAGRVVSNLITRAIPRDSNLDTAAFIVFDSTQRVPSPPGISNFFFCFVPSSGTLIPLLLARFNRLQD